MIYNLLRLFASEVGTGDDANETEWSQDTESLSYRNWLWFETSVIKICKI